MQNLSDCVLPLPFTVIRYYSAASPSIILSAKCNIHHCLSIAVASNITVICSSACTIYNNSTVFYRSNSLYSIIQQLHLQTFHELNAKSVRLYFPVAIHCNPYHSTAPLIIILSAKCNSCHCLYFTVAINITVTCNIHLHHLQSFYCILP